MYRLHCQNNPQLFGFLTRKAHTRKTRISYWFLGKRCTCATSLYLSPYVVCSTLRAAGDPRKVTSHVAKNPNNTSERGASVYIGQKKKNSEKPAEFQKTTLQRWVFRFRFFSVFWGSCLATSNEKPECEKTRVFYASVNGSIVAISSIKIQNLTLFSTHGPISEVVSWVRRMSAHLCFRSWERELSDLPIFNFQPQMFMRTFMECFLHICGYRTEDRWLRSVFEWYFKGMPHFSAFGWFIIHISQ